MSILFYDHLFSKQQIQDIVDQIEESENLKSRLHQLVDDIIYQGLVAMILGKLKESKHEIFLEMLHDRPYDTEIILFLREHTHDQIEDDIRQEAEKLLGTILKDMLP